MRPDDLARRELDAVLTRRPRHPASPALQQRVAALMPAARAPEGRPATSSLGWRVLAPLASACAGGLLVWLLVRPAADDRATPADMVAEAINDHLRVVESTRPIEIESGGIHQVKPWFTGRLDFAPRVALSDDSEFPLAGGSLGVFRDRKAAVFVFTHRLHKITLLVFPAERLPWRASGLKGLGPIAVDEQSARGFTTLLWREGDLGYALVSDVAAADLERLAARINHP